MKIFSFSRQAIMFSLLLLAPLLLSAGGNEKIVGQWYTGDKGAIVEIYECAKAQLCGRIVWIKEPNDPDTGKPKVDQNNPDPKLRNTPALGMNILSGFVKDDEDEWEDGKIYDPESGKTYSSKMTLEGDKLEVRGFVGVSLFGRTEVWTRKK